MTQKEKAPSGAIVRRPVKQGVEQPGFTKRTHQSQESFFGPITNGAARRGLSEWRVAHEEAKRWAELTWSQNLKALRQARKVLRSGGFLLHVDPASGAERRITVKEAGEGVPFLSVWVRGGMEVTLIRSQNAYGTPLPGPRGVGWQFVYQDPVEQSTEWRRPHVEGDRS